jgi:ornithine cyclodeaminase/alanine dehydrogenase-like protein (mu-crystallin family)
MTVPFVDAEELGRRLPMIAAIDALEVAFRDGDPSSTPLRSQTDTAAGSLLLMPAASSAGVGVKMVTLTEANPARGLPLIHALYVLFDAAAQAPRLLIEGGALTGLRTAAVSGLATRLLARPDARRLVIFGAGVQARAHLVAMAAVRPVAELAVVSRTPERAAELVGIAGAMGIRAGMGGSDAVADADIICTCTTATEPLFDGRRLPEGAHVNAVGAYRPEARELDTETVRRARVVVETRDAAWEEAGDLVIPLGEGAIERDHVIADLQELAQGAEVRRGPGDVTLFESVGLASEDLAVATAFAETLE